MSNEPNQQLTKAPTSTELKAPPTPEESAFALLIRQARMLSESTLVPKAFQGSIPNCGIAIEIAHRLGVSPFMVAQNMDVIHGRPGFRATFLIAMVNASKRFTPLQYQLKETGKPTSRRVNYEAWENGKKVPREIEYKYTPTTCIAYATNKETGEMVEGPPVSYDLAIEEGWVGKDGSKWLTSMRELMIRYRAAAFFSRLYTPDVTLGFQTTDEIEEAIEIPERNVTPAKVPAVAGLFAPVETPARTHPVMLAAKLEEAGIELADATEYLRSQAVTEAATFNDITPEEAAAALAGFAHLAAALAPVAP